MCATTPCKILPLKGTTITKKTFYVNAILLETVVSGHLPQVKKQIPLHHRKTINSIVNTFSILQPIKGYRYTSCLQLFYHWQAPIGSCRYSQLFVEILKPYSVIHTTHLSQFQERFQYKQDILDAVYILSHLFPVKPGKQWQTAFIKGREVSSKSVATSCVVCPSKQVPPFKQTKSKHGCGTANRNMRIF